MRNYCRTCGQPIDEEATDNDQKRDMGVSVAISHLLEDLQQLKDYQLEKWLHKLVEFAVADIVTGNEFKDTQARIETALALRSLIAR
jgi:hypothetical protein